MENMYYDPSQYPEQPIPEYPQYVPMGLGDLLKAWFSGKPLNAYRVYLAPMHSAILFGITVLVSAFFLAVVTGAMPKTILTSFMSTMTALSGGNLSGMNFIPGLSSASSQAAVETQVNYFLGQFFWSEFLYGLLTSLILLALVFLAVLLIVRICYGGFYASTVFSLIAATTVPYLVITLVGSILTLIFGSLAMAFIVFSLMIPLLCLYMGQQIYFGEPRVSPLWIYAGFTLLFVLLMLWISVSISVHAFSSNLMNVVTKYQNSTGFPY